MSLGSLPYGSYPVATAMEASDFQVAPNFDARATVISQYANSPRMLALIDGLTAAFDRNAQFEEFITRAWDINTATGFGLDIIGRKVGVARALYVANEEYLGFSDQTGAQPFGHGVFYSAYRLTPNFNLPDASYRRLILVRAALNITDCAIPTINKALMTLFPGYGNCYVRDNLDMTMTYVFGAKLSKVDYAIVTQSGALPKPAGVSYTVEQP